MERSHWSWCSISSCLQEFKILGPKGVFLTIFHEFPVYLEKPVNKERRKPSLYSSDCSPKDTHLNRNISNSWISSADALWENNMQLYQDRGKNLDIHTWNKQREASASLLHSFHLKSVRGGGLGLIVPVWGKGNRKQSFTDRWILGLALRRHYLSVPGLSSHCLDPWGITAVDCQTL